MGLNAVTAAVITNVRQPWLVTGPTVEGRRAVNYTVTVHFVVNRLVGVMLRSMKTKHFAVLILYQFCLPLICYNIVRYQ